MFRETHVVIFTTKTGRLAAGVSSLIFNPLFDANSIQAKGLDIDEEFQHFYHELRARA
jgi:hypothetical protein